MKILGGDTIFTKNPRVTFELNELFKPNMLQNVHKAYLIIIQKRKLFNFLCSFNNFLLLNHKYIEIDITERSSNIFWKLSKYLFLNFDYNIKLKKKS
ncbi:hypothetical protein BpHYR1_034867 [Brachionus plicatilis]|uniref:Uncharacterized protein n=1 Tax=Brachionus plicatilis TaxID=10195 RepID=A0A3M7SHN9_BRAPC|nr:hypothetical protein BpHYR1_034867 [Brachionus plicatilis]